MVKLLIFKFWPAYIRFCAIEKNRFLRQNYQTKRQVVCLKWQHGNIEQQIYKYLYISEIECIQIKNASMLTHWHFVYLNSNIFNSEVIDLGKEPR